MGNVTLKQKKHTPSSWIRTTNNTSKGEQPTCSIYVRIDVWKKNDKKTKTAPAAWRRREHGREGEQGEARPAMSAPRGGPHLDLGRLRLKTWSKSDFSLAETTWPTYLYIYLLYLP